MVGIAVNYRLAPAAVYPAQLDDVRAALAYVRAHASRYKIDPTRVGALGSSAGGHLAALLATYGTGSKSSGSRIAVVAARSGIYDFMTMPTYALVDGTKVSTFLGCDVTACPDKWVDASPAAHVDPTDPLMYMANGTPSRSRANSRRTWPPSSGPRRSPTSSSGLRAHSTGAGTRARSGPRP